MVVVEVRRCGSVNVMKVVRVVDDGDRKNYEAGNVVEMWRWDMVVVKW